MSFFLSLLVAHDSKTVFVVLDQPEKKSFCLTNGIFLSDKLLLEAIRVCKLIIFS